MRISEMDMGRIQAIYDADSPEKYANAISIFLSSLAIQAYDSAVECSNNWQDNKPNKPWVKLGRKIDTLGSNLAKFGSSLWRHY